MPCHDISHLQLCAIGFLMLSPRRSHAGYNGVCSAKTIAGTHEEEMAGKHGLYDSPRGNTTLLLIELQPEGYAQAMDNHHNFLSEGDAT